MLQPLTNTTMMVVLTVLMVVLVLGDLRSRRIPNRLVILGIAIALLGNLIVGGLVGLAATVGGAVIGLLCLLPFYASGGMGAGDVKMMAMCGAFIGPVYVIPAAVASLVFGSILGIAWYFRYFKLDTDEGSPADEARRPSVKESKGGTPPMPYALAISGGVISVLVASPYLSSVLV